MELPAVRRTQPITISQKMFNNQCPIAENGYIYNTYIANGEVETADNILPEPEILLVHTELAHLAPKICST